MIDKPALVEQPDGALAAAVAWITSHPEGVTVHEIKQRFGMTALQACEAIKAARDAGTSIPDMQGKQDR